MKYNIGYKKQSEMILLIEDEKVIKQIMRLKQGKLSNEDKIQQNATTEVQKQITEVEKIISELEDNPNSPFPSHDTTPNYSSKM